MSKSETTAPRKSEISHLEKSESIVSATRPSSLGYAIWKYNTKFKLTLLPILFVKEPLLISLFHLKAHYIALTRRIFAKTLKVSRSGGLELYVSNCGFT